ncbi:hypothetical protein QFC20_002573 [Naganishia adeliensis]|uniref:Uncharacterized protein n=1 Tax=Naganishia adeliensis TaxID=92952 RepID=A0ACC2WJM6_9TREE|nr:hypothetical protein QFC20_002573 [Naganishia adeliensis]
MIALRCWNGSFEKVPHRKAIPLLDGSQHSALSSSAGEVAENDPYLLLASTVPAIETLVLRLPVNLGPAGARNAGIDCVIAELGNDPGSTILFLTDLDCLPLKEWIHNGYQAVLQRRPSLGKGIADGSEPLLVGGITSSATASPSIYSYYHDFYGTLNPRMCTSPSPSALEARPRYAPSCNLVIYPGNSNSGKQLPRFHEGFKEPSIQDVFFCLEAMFRRGCDLVLDKASSPPGRR